MNCNFQLLNKTRHNNTTTCYCPYVPVLLLDWLAGTCSNCYTFALQQAQVTRTHDAIHVHVHTCMHVYACIYILVCASDHGLELELFIICARRSIAHAFHMHEAQKRTPASNSNSPALARCLLLTPDTDRILPNSVNFRE